jgi:hypothetical protein
MKKVFCSFPIVLIAGAVIAQKYPEPEFSNEVYFLKKDSLNSLVRLEKNNSKMDTKMKMGGFAGSETGYEIDGDKSPVRISGGNNLSFVFSTGASASAGSSSSSRDSMMRANGMDPSMFQGMSGMDPVSMLSLYKVETEKNKRKVLLQKSGGALPFGSHKIKSSDKYTFSAKKIREGYWEFIIDKNLPRGEYAFTMMDMSGTGAGGILIFAFAID